MTVRVDVRSPSEFEKGHIPNAINIPLFSDEERAEVGTLYHQQGRLDAVALGLEFVAPKSPAILEEASSIDGPLEIYCWRGGMRSEAVALLLKKGGLEVTQKVGGYKAFRTWVRDQFEVERTFHILAGRTGSGKTAILHKLAKLGEPIVDLEGIANHKGSSFGMLGQPPQPSQEHFENLLATHLEGKGKVWIEDESRMVGNCKIPDPLFSQMEGGRRHWIRRSKEERMKRLVAEYGTCDRSDLIAATERIQRRLGSERTKHAVVAIRTGDLHLATEQILHYYDKAYFQPDGEEKKLSDSEWADALLEAIDE